MKPVFLDTVGIVALWNKRDQWHAAANDAFRVLLAERAILYSTTYVIAECANALSRVPVRGNLAKLVAGLNKTGGLHVPTDVDWNEAWARYVSGPSGSPGMVDRLSFQVMRRFGLTRVFTNDQHFFDEGFSPLF
ncbi:MAG TPA: hypothetical protein VGO11_16420 [Chthoniobacteraceae bacterium]|nr:hypothetical protein [Chthoniobacteraceae bacterium]